MFLSSPNQVQSSFGNACYFNSDETVQPVTILTFPANCMPFLYAPQIMKADSHFSQPRGHYRTKFNPLMLTPFYRKARPVKHKVKKVKCNVCGVVLNSDTQARQHFSGKSHSRALRKIKRSEDCNVTNTEYREKTDQNPSTTSCDSTEEAPHTSSHNSDRLFQEEN